MVVQNLYKDLKSLIFINLNLFIIIIRIKIILVCMSQQFGKLTNLQQMQNYFQKMRGVSRAELLSSIYKNDGKVPQNKIEKDLTQAFMAITQNYNFDPKAPIVNQILHLFNIKPSELDFKDPDQRATYLNRKIIDSLQQKIKNLPSDDEIVEYSYKNNNPENSVFDWVGVKSNFPNLRGIFQEILLQKVRLFDEQLSRLTQMNTIQDSTKQQIATTARTHTFGLRTLSKQSKSTSTFSVRSTKKQLQKKGFTNVLIRDHSQFSLKKWTKKQQKQFQYKKRQFKVNFNKNGSQTPVIFQFVKKYTKTVKARDNIFQKFQNRQKNGITAQQLRYLCSTSLFLNQTLNKSQKDRLNRNIKSLGKELISKLQFNIAQKIIETYKQFMKKVADLRAHYYEQLTEKRKNQYNELKRKQFMLEKHNKKLSEFEKFKQIFTNICSSEKMKVILNPKVHRWVKLFITNLKKQYVWKTGRTLYQDRKCSVFNRLAINSLSAQQLHRSKNKYPSTRVIKRQDIGTLKQPMRKYIQTERFFYENSFQKKIKTLNSLKIKSERSHFKQLSGGPHTKNPDTVVINMGKKEIVLSSNFCLQAIIKIQAKWRAVFQRRKYLNHLQYFKEEMQKDFEERKKSLKFIYPIGSKISVKAIKDRLKRVSMRTLNILKPYVRTIRKPINNYTSFSQANFSLAELKSKQAKNSSRRLGQFGKMVQLNQFPKLIKSGFVVTSKEINDSFLKDGASAMWWAVKNSNVDLTRIFLQGGGNPNSKNYENSTCLHQAMQNGDVQIIFLLLDYGADLNIKNNKKVTALYYATPRMLKLLGLKQGVISGEQSLKDNNSLYYKPSVSENLYQDHYF